MFIFAVVASYLLGSIPFGKIIAYFAGVNIQKLGSGNIGFANSWRVLGLKKAIFVLIFDILKGYISIVLFHGHLGTIQLYILSLAPVIGHCYPIWLKFRGGKGVATSVGVILALSPFLGLMGMAAWALLVLITRRAAIASLSAILIMTLLSFYIDAIILPAIATMLIIVVIKHRKNITRLYDGSEPKISWKLS